MIYQGPWLLGYIADTAAADFTYGFFHFPRFPDGHPDSQRDVVAGIDALWVSASSAHHEKIGQLLSGFTDPATQMDYILKTRNISAMNGVEPPPDRAGDMIWQIADAMKQTGEVIPWWDISLLPPRVSETMMSHSQKLLIGETSPQDFAASLDTAAGR
jgi:ABC-type glycerol-3-phosphate transport system substrate-binding protein